MVNSVVMAAALRRVHGSPGTMDDVRRPPTAYRLWARPIYTGVRMLEAPPDTATLCHFFGSATGHRTRSSSSGTRTGVYGSELSFVAFGDRKVGWHVPRKTAILHLRGCSLCLAGAGFVDFSGPLGRAGGGRLRRGVCASWLSGSFALPAVLAQQELDLAGSGMGSVVQVRLVQKRQSWESQNVTNEPNTAQLRWVKMRNLELEWGLDHENTHER